MASLSDEQTKALSKQEDFSYAMQLVTGGSVSMVLRSAFRLGMFETIAQAGPGAQLSASQIAANMSSKNPVAALMVDRMLYLLASHSVLTCSTMVATNSGVERVYGLAPVAKYFVGNPELGGASLGYFLVLAQDKIMNECWYALDDVVLEGGVPFNKVHGAHLFEYPGRDPRFNDVFNQGMIGHTAIVVSSLLERYKGFQDLKNLVDVGGGIGFTISRITAMYPFIEGFNFDLPHVLQHAPIYPGVQHIGGDMFQSLPKGDAIFMKWILHDWDDDHCLKLLKNCYSSLPDNGKIIVVDALLPVNPDTSSTVKTTSQMNAFMLTQCPGGKERSEHEFMALATAAGFKGIKKECFVCNLWVMEFYK